MQNIVEVDEVIIQIQEVVMTAEIKYYLRN